MGNCHDYWKPPSIGIMYRMGGVVHQSESKTIDSLSYSRKDSKEYFADAFMMYCKYPYTLKNKFPKTYNYIAQTLQDI